MEQDEIYLIDLWRTLSREWKWFAAVLTLTLVCTYAFAHLAKRQWEATAWIQIGQVGSVPAGQDPKAEPLLRVIERLQLVSFENQILNDAGYSPESPTAQLYRNSMKLEPMPYAGPLIRMKVRAYSRQQALTLATATVDRLAAVHKNLLAASQHSARASLVRIETNLQSAQVDQARYEQAAAREVKGNAGGNDTQRSMLGSLLFANKEEEVRNLQQARGDLLDRLSPTYTYGTSMIWPAYVPDRQVFPNPALTWGIGLLLGFFLGTSATLARSAARRRVRSLPGLV